MGAVGHRARKVTDHLSVEGLSLMNKGFQNRKTSAEIAREIEAATGERVNPRTVGRRALEWRAAMDRIQAQKDQMRALVAAMEEGDLTASAVIKALALKALMDDPDAFGKQNPLKVQSQNLRAEELIIKREGLAIKAREVAVNEARLQLLQDREQKAAAIAAELGAKANQGSAITAEDIGRIRAIYGL